MSGTIVRFQPLNADRPVESAQELLQLLRHDELALLGVLVEACRRESNPVGIERWARLARYLHEAMIDESLPAGIPADDRWREMQRVERYRRRAVAAELRAAEASPEQRREMLDLATEWWDLAIMAQLSDERDERPRR